MTAPHVDPQHPAAGERRQERAQLLSAGDAALILGVAPATLRDWRRRGLLTPHRGGVYDVHELLAAQAAAKPRRTATRRTA